MDLCTTKYGRVNQKIITVYVEVQPQIVNKRIEEMNKMQADLAYQGQTESEQAANAQQLPIEQSESVSHEEASVNITKDDRI